jgi:hypothetical protein
VSVRSYLLFVAAIVLASNGSGGVGLFLGSLSSNAMVGLALSKSAAPEWRIVCTKS